MEPLKDGPLKEDFPKKDAADPNATNDNPQIVGKAANTKAKQ